MDSLICFDRCPLDTFGFYRNHTSGQDMPAVRTKDFDGSAPSRGHEVTMYPIAFRVFRYEGCAGCELTYTYPQRLFASYGGQDYSLPRISRSGFYIPKDLRKRIASNPLLSLKLRSSTVKVFKGARAGKEEVIRIPEKALKAYSQMLRTLKFDQ